MTKYREIIRLTSLGLSQRSIMHSIGAAQKTVVSIYGRPCTLLTCHSLVCVVR